MSLQVAFPFYEIHIKSSLSLYLYFNPHIFSRSFCHFNFFTDESESLPALCFGTESLKSCKTAGSWLHFKLSVSLILPFEIRLICFLKEGSGQQVLGLSTRSRTCQGQRNSLDLFTLCRLSCPCRCQHICQ